MADAYRNMPLEQRISSIRDGDATNYGTPVRSRRLIIQPRKKTDMHYYWQEGSATGVDPDAPKIWAPIYPQVNQDIVTRLRVIHCAADDLTPCGTCLTCQAADEIERLRAERDSERDLADQLASALLDGSFRGSSSDRRDRVYGSGWEAVHDALDVYEEARRG